MTIVSTKEFNSNQEKYFDMAINEQVFVQRGDYTFIVSRVNEPNRKHKKPDEKLRSAISIDEVHTLCANDHEDDFGKEYSNSITGNELRQKMHKNIDAWQWNEK